MFNLSKRGLAIPQVVNFAKLQLKKSVVQSIPNLTLTSVLWDAPTIIDSTFYNYNVGTGLLTLLSSGWYVITFNVFWVFNTAGFRVNQISLADSVLRVYNSSYSSATPIIINDQNTLTVLTRSDLPNATILFNVLQNSGAALNFGGNVNAEVNINKLQDL